MKFLYKIILPSSFAELEPNSLSQITKLSEIHSRTKKLKLLFTFWKLRIVCLCCGLVQGGVSLSCGLVHVATVLETEGDKVNFTAYSG